MVSRAELSPEKVVREIRCYIPTEDFQQKIRIKSLRQLRNIWHPVSNGSGNAVI
jgi:hypothetical protein